MNLETSTTQPPDNSPTQKQSEPQSLLSIVQALSELDPDAPENEETIKKYLQMFDGKVENYFHAQQFLLSRIERLDAMKEHYAYLVEQSKKHLDSLKERALYVLNAMNIKSLTTDDGFSIVKKTTYSTIAPDDASVLPMEYVRVIPQSLEPDKVAIKAALENGVVIPGCALRPKETAVISKPKGKKK